MCTVVEVRLAYGGTWGEWRLEVGDGGRWTMDDGRVRDLQC